MSQPYWDEKRREFIRPSTRKGVLNADEAQLQVFAGQREADRILAKLSKEGNNLSLIACAEKLAGAAIEARMAQVENSEEWSSKPRDASDIRDEMHAAVVAKEHELAQARADADSGYDSTREEAEVQEYDRQQREAATRIVRGDQPGIFGGGDDN